MNGIEDLITNVERAEKLQNVLIARATHISEASDEDDFKKLRSYFLSKPETKQLVPDFVRINRNFDQFWNFIKYKIPDYAGRRSFIWAAFEPLIRYLESSSNSPAESSIDETLEALGPEGINQIWGKALERKISDPEGAITIARTLLESTCKLILDNKHIEYDSSKIELHTLYKLTAKALNLSPDQHTERIFKQILGGCSAIINGLGTLRNALGDAHGKGLASIKPETRHAELAINLSGAMTQFLIQTFEKQKEVYEICYSCKKEFSIQVLIQAEGDTMLCSDCAKVLLG